MTCNPRSDPPEGFVADAASIAKALDLREKDVVDMQYRQVLSSYADLAH